MKLTEINKDDLYQRADEFAEKAHGSQARKYTNDPYINHPRAVAKIVARVTNDPEMLAAAVLHDVIEDCGVSKQQLVDMFGQRVADLVEDLTDVSRPEDGNRSARKTIDRHHTAQAHPDAKTIKLADLIHNTMDIVKHDPKFAKVYMKEKQLLMDVLKEGHPTLYNMAADFIARFFEKYPD